jgi:hypothetical protein
VQRKISRRALFARDGWRCVYCGSAGGRLTLDHVVPKSRGGESVWENVVTSCSPCNLRKGNRLPHEVHMELHQHARRCPDDEDRNPDAGARKSLEQRRGGAELELVEVEDVNRLRVLRHFAT